MEVRSFNAELAIATMMLNHLFGNIIIERQESNGQTKRIPVTCVFGQRSRILKNWENSEKRATMNLPMIALNRTGYTRNGDRLNNLHNEVKYEINSKNRSYDLLTPVPIDISYDLVIMARYMNDIDQIASNIMVMFNNDGYFQSIHPKYEGLVLRNQLVLGDAVTEEHPDEIDAGADDFIITTFNITLKTYLFGGVQKAHRAPTKVLSTYTSSFVSTYLSTIKIDDVDELKEQYKELTVQLTSYVTSDLTTYVDSTDESSYVYEGFVPMIQSIDMGFYPTPHISSHVPYMEEVDGYPLSCQAPYVDRVIWTIGEQGKLILR